MIRLSKSLWLAHLKCLSKATAHFASGFICNLAHLKCLSKATAHFASGFICNLAKTIDCSCNHL